MHPSQITQWKKQAVEEMSLGFSGGRLRRERSEEALVASFTRRCMCEPFSRNSSKDEGMAGKARTLTTDTPI